MLLQQSMNQSIQIFKSHTRAQEKPHTSTLSRGSTFCVSIYKILFHFNALLWESIILVLPPPPPPAKPTLLQYVLLLQVGNVTLNVWGIRCRDVPKNTPWANPHTGTDTPLQYKGG